MKQKISNILLRSVRPPLTSGVAEQRAYGSRLRGASAFSQAAQREDESHSSSARQRMLDSGLQSSTNTELLSELICHTTLSDLSPRVIQRSKRMILDTLGVAILGALRSETTHAVLRFHDEWMGQVDAGTELSKRFPSASMWGAGRRKTSVPMAAFINGVSVHSMDFDDTWHPATHPSGPVLPAVLALAEGMTGIFRPDLSDILVAYNVGIQVQGMLLNSSRGAEDIPDRFHPPAVVGVMGAAAAASRLLELGPRKTRHAIAIAASHAGAPMANAGTKAKPLHSGKPARLGLEAALLADAGIEGNEQILDIASGFGAFYDDFEPSRIQEQCRDVDNLFVLDKQDVAIKRLPAHLAMHWTNDATNNARAQICDKSEVLDPEKIQEVVARVPNSRYINRPLPNTEHEARHSFQFMVGSTLLDGHVGVDSFVPEQIHRKNLQDLLQKITVIPDPNNRANFEKMHVEVEIKTTEGGVVTGRCDTPYGHWRNPLSDQDVQLKFLNNTSHLPVDVQREIMATVFDMDSSSDPSSLLDSLSMT